MLQQGEIDRDDQSNSAGVALTYIFQAISLEESHFRQNQLTRLAHRAIRLLHSGENSPDAQHEFSAPPSETLLARVWLTLLKGVEEVGSFEVGIFPPANIKRALELIELEPESSNWLITKLYYDLVIELEPRNFTRQIEILEELMGTGFHMPAQMSLEHAVLLYQVGRYREGSEAFRNLRHLLKMSETIISLPERLRWLLRPDGRGRRLCEAIVTEDAGPQSYARIKELGSTSAPFRPQEFDQHSMRPNSRFNCHVSFRAMGPFLRPPSERHA